MMSEEASWTRGGFARSANPSRALRDLADSSLRWDMIDVMQSSEENTHRVSCLSINPFTQIHTFATNVLLPCLTVPFIPTPTSPPKWLSFYIDNSCSGHRNANPGPDNAALSAAGDDYRIRRGAGAERDQGDGGVKWDFAIQASKQACRSGRLHSVWFL